MSMTVVVAAGGAMSRGGLSARAVRQEEACAVTTRVVCAVPVLYAEQR